MYLEEYFKAVAALIVVFQTVRIMYKSFNRFLWLD